MARALGRVLAAGFNGQDLERFLEKSVVTPVLTAHPTEVQRRAVLNRQRDLARLLLERDRLQLTREERAGQRGRRSAATYSPSGRPASCARCG